MSRGPLPIGSRGEKGKAGSRPTRRRRAIEWWRETHWYFLAALAAVSFVLGIVGFLRWFAMHDTPGGFLDAAYRSIQLFTFESGSVGPPLPFALALARFLAIATTLYGASAAVVAVFGERISRFALRTAKGHAVVCGLGDRGVYIVERLLDRKMKVVVIERDEHAPQLDRVRGAGAVIIMDDASEPSVLLKARAHRARYVIAACAEDGDNAEIAVRLAALVRTRPPSTPVTVIAHIYDSELCDLLREQTLFDDESDETRLVFFNVPESGARAMLEAVPPSAPDGTPAEHVVVVGLGKLGRSLVVQMARTWWAPRADPGHRPRLTLIDREADTKVELLRIRYPRLDEVCRLDVRQMKKNAPEFERGSFLYEGDDLAVDAVYICPDDDVHSLAMALAVLHHTRYGRVPIAVRMSQQAGFAALIGAEGAGGSGFSDLRAVGVLDATCDIEVLLGGRREAIARAVHRSYVLHERSAGRTQDDNPSMVPWDELPETLRESNRCQADDIEAKLAAVGMRIVPLDDRSSEPARFSHDELEMLARREHDRWMRERESQGWTFGLDRDTPNKKSPYLVPWEDLDEDTREKDRQAVRGIPEFLGGAGFTTSRGPR